MATPGTFPPRRRPTRTAVARGLLLATCAALSYAAALTSSRTIDGPAHRHGGWLTPTCGDDRLAGANRSGREMFAAGPDAAGPVRRPRPAVSRGTVCLYDYVP